MAHDQTLNNRSADVAGVRVTTASDPTHLRGGVETSVEQCLIE